MTIRTVPLDEQDDASRHDDLTILVVGAGVAGLAAAQLLRADGHHPILVERRDPEADAGYMVALMPLADGPIADLGVRQEYLARSVPLDRFRFRAHSGRSLRTDGLEDVVGRYGDYRGLTRGALLDVIAGEDAAVTHRTTVTGLDEDPEGVGVTVETEGTVRTLRVDAVVIADGIGSRTRSLLPGAAPLHRVETGWGGWVAWTPLDADVDLGEELWGDGFFIGTYPVPGALGAFVGGPEQETRQGPAAFADVVRRKLGTAPPRIEDALRAVAAAEAPFFWPLADVRAARWTTRRTVLLGDAAAGFLPTAGIGAGMALESAWVLASHLRGATTETIGEALAAYESAQRPRVETAQNTSRSLARLMFRRGRALASARDLLLRVLSIGTALRPIVRLLADRPALPARQR
ncbi:hypothetical protein BH708_15545 [Brachybacterium sp. P6-10-X1]|uniref:FAD-dependent oxidoreductase n=1 Tax=Brachybacterium sp. P6-10-X1 TaxID=1903186 RepID=UPI000971B4DE|nr:NAD(P)/FAD-dependent oxidoreductase [Brachybacterium sp. P6-10-X1]APX33891.1 hypothetical protein BH708_15545 [Brachybacterium sp. P6-10-X1]